MTRIYSSLIGTQLQRITKITNNLIESFTESSQLLEMKQIVIEVVFLILFYFFLFYFFY